MTFLQPLIITFSYILLVLSVHSLYEISFFYWNLAGFALSKIPGPRLAPFSRLWILINVYQFGFAEKCVHLAKTYGPVVRIGPNHVLISDPADIRKVLAVGSSYTRGPWFDALKLHHDETNIVSEREPKRHQLKRNILSVGLLGKNSQSLEPTVDQHLRQWIGRLHECCAAGNNKNVDIMRTFRFLTVDVLSHLALGQAFGSMEADKDLHDFIRIFNAGTTVQKSLSVFPELKTFLVMLSHVPVLGGYLAPSPGDGSPLGKVLTIIQGVVKDRFSGRGPKVEMLDSFIARGLAERDAMEELLIIMSAGVETTTTAVEAILYQILQTPGVLSKLQKEIQEAIKLDPSYPMQEQTLRNMTYFKACISEGLRMYPPSFQLRERLTPASGDQLGDHFIPAGTFIGINSKAAQLIDVVGDNIESFRPERWLINDAEKVAQMSRNLELVFNYGSTKCLGINIASMLLNKVIVELLRNFDMGVESETQGKETIPRKLLLQLDLKSAKKS